MSDDVDDEHINVEPNNYSTQYYMDALGPEVQVSYPKGIMDALRVEQSEARVLEEAKNNEIPLKTLHLFQLLMRALVPRLKWFPTKNLVT